MILGPASAIVVGALGATVYNLSAWRSKKLKADIKNDLAGLESRLEKQIQNNQDVFLGALILTLENQATVSEKHPLAQKAEIAAGIKR